YPAWLLERVYAEHGKKAALDFALSALEPAPVYVAGNLALQGDRETRALLESKGLEGEPTELEGSFVLGKPAGLAPSGLVESTQLIVADLSAQRIAAAAGVKPGDRVLEVGQGRGTKTLLLESAALRAGGAVRLTGVDSEAFKVRIAKERLQRAGLSAWVSCVAADGCTLDSPDLPAELVGSFDLVFLDAPCSGTGTLRRHPEIAWRLEPAAVDRANPDSLPALQLRLLTAAAARVATGGVLCYATCSVLREENEAVVEEFLAGKRGSSFELEGASFGSHPAPGAPDGHFCARLVRKA
ncbi:MAG: RsmB/NOP family class I SAM-dependent RNA methyltransferase, partial [Coriobacteriales bacterium]|nr:RsmB/NOP family class I SAM-dependent RNA methyltransferase [Coriobacteriales bacterium]